MEPLKEETFLSGEDTQQLFGNIQEIVQFQHMFLQSLEEAVQLEPNFSNLADPKQFRVSGRTFFPFVRGSLMKCKILGLDFQTYK